MPSNPLIELQARTVATRLPVWVPKLRFAHYAVLRYSCITLPTCRVGGSGGLGEAPLELEVPELASQYIVETPVGDPATLSPDGYANLGPAFVWLPGSRWISTTPYVLLSPPSDIPSHQESIIPGDSRASAHERSLS